MGRQTNTTRRAHETAVRQKAAAARAASQRRERRRRLWLVAGSTVTVLVVIGVIVAVGVTSSSHRSNGSTSRSVAAASVVSGVRGVSSSTLDAVGKGTLTAAPKAANGAPLTVGGKPQVLFIGAEYCPYCAAERWSLVQALSRFGTFTGLKSIHSSPTDAYPDTATFSFYGSRYSSSTIALTAREVETVTGAQLETPSQAETALWTRYTGSPGSFPFLDIGGRYVVTGPSYDPGVLKGLTAQQIAAALADPTSPVAKAVDGTANVLTAAICRATGGTPTSVCSTAGVTAAAKALNG